MAGVALAAGIGIASSTVDAAEESRGQGLLGGVAAKDVDISKLPVYTAADLASHNSLETGVWVTFGGLVYDVSQWVAQHPGGGDFVLAAGGGSLGPWWNMYRQHKTSTVLAILRTFLIGKLDTSDPDAQELLLEERASDDPFAHDPVRDEGILVREQKPFNGETPPAGLHDFLTPTELFFVRHHHPVPPIDEKTHRLVVDSGKGVFKGPGALRLSMDDIKTKFPKHEVDVTIQCGGNRRSTLFDEAPVLGLPWGVGAIGTARFGGVRLGDLLKMVGVKDSQAYNEVWHVVMEAMDAPYDCSVPLQKALDPDTLIAYEMNGKPLPPDHGFPLRAIVPGYLGARHVKWVNRLTVSREEAHSTWQRGIAYKLLPPGTRSLKGVDASKLPPINEMPVQSAITKTEKSSDGKTLHVEGYAWSGGGRGIVRVDVAAGEEVMPTSTSWHTAALGQGSQQSPYRAWAWTRWQADVPLPASGEKVEVVCKAVDIAGNQQPELGSTVWNLRGILNNSWHRVKVE